MCLTGSFHVIVVLPAGLFPIKTHNMPVLADFAAAIFEYQTVPSEVGGFAVPALGVDGKVLFLL